MNTNFILMLEFLDFFERRLFVLFLIFLGRLNSAAKVLFLAFTNEQYLSIVVV